MENKTIKLTYEEFESLCMMLDEAETLALTKEVDTLYGN